MNFGQAFLFLFALANSVNAETDDPNERLLATSRDKDTFYVRGYHENLGECNGAVCGLWGDPHILTCDGLGYDCNAAGIFTIMKNSLYNIQANFIHVNSIEMGKVLDWGNFPSATYTNDIIIQNVLDPTVPIMQFTFPHFHTEEDMAPSERGCFVRFSYDSHELARLWPEERTIVGCRKACEDRDGCEKFVYKHDNRCQLFGENAKIKKIPSSWSRRVAGPVEKCGHPEFYDSIEDNNEQTAKAKVIPNGSGNKGGCRKGDGCPVNFYVDGELRDISNLDGDYLYGDESSAVSAKFSDYNQIRIKHTAPSGAISEIMLETAGDGPGELFSCHWNMFVCLPAADEDFFHHYELELGEGLFGSPDNNSHNDWMTPEGDELDLPSHNGREGQAAYDYCLDNWCVSQEDSLMVYPEGTTYENVKCKKENFTTVDVNDPDFACVVSADHIKEVCGQKPLMIRAACEVDCCLGGCDAQDEMEDELTDLVDLSNDPDDCIYPTPTPPAAVCDDSDNFLSTGETACPSTAGESIVKVIDSTTSVEIPDGQPVIYGIKFIPVTDDDHGRRITFRVDNPFGSVADTYVRYQKEVGVHANDPACESLPGVQPGCDVESKEITVGCVEYPGVDAFTIVDVYFASLDPFVTGNADDSTEVEKCCKAPEYDGSIGIIKYSFKIQCVCPTDA